MSWGGEADSREAGLEGGETEAVVQVHTMGK